MEVPSTDFEILGEPINSPADFDGLVEAIKVLDSYASEADQEHLIGQLRALSESDILKLSRMKVPGVNEGKLNVLEHLCVMKPSSKKVFCDVLKILLGNEDIEDVCDDVPPLLLLAAYCGNYEAVTVLCSTEGTNIFAKDSRGFNALHMAVISGDTRIARDIMFQAYRKSARNFNDLLNACVHYIDMTPLHFAAWEGDESMTDILLNWKRTVEVVGRSDTNVVVNAEARTAGGLTALHLAAMNHRIGVLWLLLDLRSPARLGEACPIPRYPVESESMRGWMLMYIEAAESHVLEFSSHRRSALQKQRTDPPLMRAVGPLWNELMKNVRPDGKAEADKEPEAHEDPLMLFLEAIRTVESPACAEAYREVLCGLLLSLTWSEIRQLNRLKFPGANGGKLTVCGHLCVSKACLQNVLSILISESESPIVEELEGHQIPLLHLAAYCSNYAAVKVLCDRWHVDLARSSTNFTALHMAVKGGDKEVVECIHKALPLDQFFPEDLLNSKDDMGMTPLHYAVWEGNQSMLEFLLHRVKKRGEEEDAIDINACEKNGLTALHLASLNNDSLSLVKLLDHSHVNVNAADNNGFTALHMASWKNHMGVFCKLFDHPQINVNATAENGLTALHMASWNNNIGVLSKLLDHPQINVNASDKHGLTALHMASWNNHIGVLCKLLDHPKINMNVVDTKGLTALYLPQGEARHQMSIDMTPLGESIRELLQSKLDDMESHLWQFAVDRKSTLDKIKEARRETTEITLVNEVPRQEQQLRGDKNRRRAAALLFSTQDLGANSQFTALHRAAWHGDSVVVTSLTDMISNAARARSVLNALDKDGMTALHFAVMRGDACMVEDILSNKSVRGNIREERTATHRTPLNMAYRLVKGDNFPENTPEEQHEIVREYRVIIGLLLEHPDVKSCIDNLYKTRQLYVDAANAILVGAALIASITFAGWLQPPLGYQPYYDSRYLLTGSAPPDTYAVYASVKQHVSVLNFWNFNSLSFFFAVATVMLGACVVLPMLGKEELEADVRRMRNLHVLTTLALSFSVLFVLGAFISAGFASLPPELKYQWGMITTTAVGGCICIVALSYYLYRVITLINVIRSAEKGDL